MSTERLLLIFLIVGWVLAVGFIVLFALQMEFIIKGKDCPTIYDALKSK